MALVGLSAVLVGPQGLLAGRRVLAARAGSAQVGLGASALGTRIVDFRLASDLARLDTTGLVALRSSAPGDQHQHGEQDERRHDDNHDHNSVHIPSPLVRVPGNLPVPTPAVASHDQAKPDSPCRSLQGEKWSDDMIAPKPAASARFACSSRRLGGICSWEQCRPTTGTL
jgi:hypothetical protein